MPYKGKFHERKVTVGGKAYHVYAKTAKEVDRKAKDLRKKKLAELDSKVTPNEWTVEDYANQTWMDSKKSCGAREQRNLRYLLNTWVIPDPLLGAADVEAYHREKHIRTSKAVDENGNQKRRRKYDAVLEEEKAERLKNADKRPTLRGMKLDEVVLSDLDAIIVGMAAGGYSVSAMRKVCLIIKQIFRRAKADKLIEDDPSEGLKVPSAQVRTVREDGHRSITESERELFLKVAETNRGGTFIYIMLYSGMRTNEVAALRWEDVDLDERIIHVRHAVKDAEKGDKRIGAPKSVAGLRDIPIPEPLYARLISEKDKQGFVVTNTQRGMYTASSIQTMWQSFKRQMDIAAGAETFRNQIVESKIADDLTLYCLRHTYCTDLARAGVPLVVAKKLMGHEKIEMTSRIYTHITDDLLDSAAAKIDAFYAKKSD